MLECGMMGIPLTEFNKYPNIERFPATA